jgi:hypothetical protein
VEWAAPALPDFSPTLPSIRNTAQLAGLGGFRAHLPTKPPRDGDLDTRERDFFGDSRGTGTNEGVPGVARLDGSATPWDLDGNRSLRRAVGGFASCLTSTNIGSCLPAPLGAPAGRNHEHSPERSVERSRERSPERSSALDPDLGESADERR